MRLVALAVVVVMLLIFVASSIWQSSLPSLRWLRAFSEAGVAGALADWYAVVALFRHPLGLPIPHTAIIPRNKDRIADSIGVFIETHFLTSLNVVEKIVRLDLAAAMADWLREPVNSRELADALCDLVSPTLATVEDAEIQTFLARTIASQLESLDAVAILDRLMTIVIDRDRDRAILAKILLWLRDWVSENRGAIKVKFGEVSRYTPGFLDSYIVNRFVEGIALLLEEAAGSPDHQIWREVDQALDELRETVRTSRALREQIATKAREAFVALVQSDIAAAVSNPGKDGRSIQAARRNARGRTERPEKTERLVANRDRESLAQRPTGDWPLDRGHRQELGCAGDRPQARDGNRHRPAVHPLEWRARGRPCRARASCGRLAHRHPGGCSGARAAHDRLFQPG